MPNTKLFLRAIFIAAQLLIPRFLSSLFSRLLVASTLLISALSANAQEPVMLSPLIVNAEEATSGTKTMLSNAEANEQIERTPGAVAVVDAEQYEDRYALNFEDTLALTPGVYAQKRFGEEVRISIRGSGLSRGFHMRGLTLLQDGIPFNLADGSADFQEADTLAFQRLEVFKGSNALQYGGTTLGGAINMVSKNGHSQPGDHVRLEAGSDSTYRGNIQSGRVFEDSDLFLSLTSTGSDGYRDHANQDNIKFNANYGKELSDKVETRFFLSVNDIKQELPGSLSLDDALNHPERAGNGVEASDQARDIRSMRLSNKTTFELSDTTKLDVGAFVNKKDLNHPITPFVGVIDQESVDYGIFAQLAGQFQLASYRNEYRVGLTSQLGENDAKVYQNIGGSHGALKSNADQKSRNAVLYGENSLFLSPQWSLITGAQLIWSERELDDNINAVNNDSDVFRAFAPKIGVMYEPRDALQVFANISRSYEVPTFSELSQGGTTGFTGVDAQEAWTAEIGTRGKAGRLSWNASIYRAWLDREMLQFTVTPNTPAATFNADNTIHQGLELGLDVQLAKSLFSSDDALLWRNAYTYSDYSFHDDKQYNNNDIAGQPSNFYQTELRYEHAKGWHVGVDWELANEADVDFANTLQAPGYGIVGLNAGYDINDQLSVFLDGRNLLDKDYVSTFSTTVDANGNTSVFYPGDGRRVFAGVRVSF